MSTVEYCLLRWRVLVNVYFGTMALEKHRDGKADAACTVQPLYGASHSSEQDSFRSQYRHSLVRHDIEKRVTGIRNELDI
jgi:hypothetical protein